MTGSATGSVTGAADGASAPASVPTAEGGFGLTPNHRGALWMLAAGLGFTLNGTLVKTLGQQGLDAYQIAFFRSLVGLLAVLPLLWRIGVHRLRSRHPWIHAFRVIFGAGAMVCGFYALTRLPLADVTALSFTTPLFATVLAVVFLREPVRWRRWSATALGFLGVLIMVRPGAGAFEPAAVVALGMAFGIAAALVLVKRLPAGESQIAMLFYFGVGSLLITAGPAAAVWQPPSGPQYLLLVAMGLLGLGSQAMMIRAFRVGEASFVAPFDYGKLLAAGLLGFFVFAEVPDLWTLTGAAIIVGATLYIARREAAVGRPAPAKAESI